MTKEELIENLKIEKKKWENKIYGVGQTRVDLMIEDVIRVIQNLQEENKKKDKVIDLMARAINNYDSQLVINTFKDKEHVIQFFEEKASDIDE